MGERQSRPVSLADDQAHGREIPPGRKRRGQVAVAVLSIVAALSQIAIPAGSARAQETPAKNDAAAKTDAPQETTPTSPSQEPEAATAADLSVRYRFLERYSPTEVPDQPERITQYQVGLRETQKAEREKQQGAPIRSQIAWQTIYTERAAQVGKMGELTSAVRRYDRFQMKDVATARAPKVPLFEGLTLLYRLQPGQKPLILNLTNDRPVRDFEYSQITRQVFLPQLTALLPPTPRLVGDTWLISARAAQGLVGEMPSSEDYEMSGTLIEVRKGGTGTTLTAVIGVSGNFNHSSGLSSLNAQIHFAFNAPPAALPASGVGTTPNLGDPPTGKDARTRNAGVVDARGFISRVLMAWTATTVLPEDEGRLKQTTTYELVLERRLSSPSNAADGGQNAPLLAPQPIPTANEANSWLLYQDPQERYFLLHPQNLVLNPAMSDPDNLHLVDQDQQQGKDAFILKLSPGAKDPQADRKFRDVGEFQRTIVAHWAKLKLETLPGPAGWLPQADWAPLKVFRKELAVKTNNAQDGGRGAQRIYIDDYLVLSKGNECFQVESWTVRDDHVAFRTQSEGIIKSVHFGKWDAQPKAPSAAPVPPLTPPN
jgi:hypothetical protein